MLLLHALWQGSQKAAATRLFVKVLAGFVVMLIFALKAAIAARHCHKPRWATAEPQAWAMSPVRISVHE